MVENATRLTDDLIARARALADGTHQPVPPRDAATVVLLRDGTDGVEAYLLRRVASMAFAAGAYVFPGGSVDPRDADHELAWAGPPAGQWAQVLRSDERLARALVCAAVRETFEESGVLLAGPGEDTVIADVSGEDWEADRVALIDRSFAFSALLEARGLVLRTDLLRPWAHWITPEIEPRRFDTRFFVAALPSGQRTRDVGGEADRVAWLRPARAVALARDGELMMMPPTISTLTELSEYDTVAEVLAAGADRDIRTVLPKVVLDGDSVALRLPGQAGYDR